MRKLIFNKIETDGRDNTNETDSAVDVGFSWRWSPYDENEVVGSEQNGSVPVTHKVTLP